MMNCTYHQKTPSVVQCNRCGRPLCPACDHRIRGFPFCQDCIVTGVELLRQQAPANPVGVVRRKSSPFVATLLSFVPGLGAAYNGQTSKAIVHFAIFASFFQMAVITEGVLFFILGVLDACRTAQLIRAGLTPEAEEDVIAQRLYGNPFAWGVTLLLIGTLFLLHTLLNVRLPIRELLPLALLGLGAYMVFDYARRRKASDRVLRFDSRRPPPSVVTGTLDTQRFRSGETTQLSRRNIEPVSFERRS
jgi:hypothetical protein